MKNVFLFDKVKKLKKLKIYINSYNISFYSNSKIKKMSLKKDQYK